MDKVRKSDSIINLPTGRIRVNEPQAHHMDDGVAHKAYNYHNGDYSAAVCGPRGRSCVICDYGKLEKETMAKIADVKIDIPDLDQRLREMEQRLLDQLAPKKTSLFLSVPMFFLKRKLLSLILFGILGITAYDKFEVPSLMMTTKEVVGYNPEMNLLTVTEFGEKVEYLLTEEGILEYPSMIPTKSPYVAKINFMIKTKGIQFDEEWPTEEKLLGVF